MQGRLPPVVLEVGAPAAPCAPAAPEVLGGGGVEVLQVQQQLQHLSLPI
eukprot:CAMPEP_0206396622 /NCGR_PEP_ID=MMETSP0294-20121207/22902_1 /ASSEMBLY_ACC=CAM_ASM_000327 /TAXON_ID=39354 /ORGANISM="Heterosigma akashiwo, Strain CCMP2393" /LENGTH=48 /DNA_ID= /DNA_START= /DNA_END= /DNA_ORIENTATION=